MSGDTYSNESNITLYAIWKYTGPDLVLFDYNSGGAKYEYSFEKGAANSVTHPMTASDISGVCTDRYAAWGNYVTTQTFDISMYDYMYFEAIVNASYNFSQFIIGLWGFGYNYNIMIALPKSTVYTPYYINISGNNYDSTQLSLGAKMKGDYLRYVKFTSEEPSGTYLGSYK